MAQKTVFTHRSDCRSRKWAGGRSRRGAGWGLPAPGNIRQKRLKLRLSVSAKKSQKNGFKTRRGSNFRPFSFGFSRLNVQTGAQNRATTQFESQRRLHIYSLEQVQSRSRTRKHCRSRQCPLLRRKPTTVEKRAVSFSSSSSRISF